VERHFEQELEQLKSNLLAMSALVESTVYRSITAVVQKDRKLAEEVLLNEARVNRMEIEIDEHAIRLLAPGTCPSFLHRSEAFHSTASPSVLRQRKYCIWFSPRRRRRPGPKGPDKDLIEAVLGNETA